MDYFNVFKISKWRLLHFEKYFTNIFGFKDAFNNIFSHLHVKKWQQYNKTSLNPRNVLFRIKKCINVIFKRHVVGINTQISTISTLTPQIFQSMSFFSPQNLIQQISSQSSCQNKISASNRDQKAFSCLEKFFS